ncbi:hypothetical protein GUJ93_ZPchr0010g9493 [Zizania palustris]|uniref:mRNA cap-binding protein n=1 Tax=Zizania palustris TaxID=103762 RepID=A0A8J5W7F5_ZIZPA|nr:hypothetical protein GUJ93_ZPchr0010g9493 [Zizania palustris]
MEEMDPYEDNIKKIIDFSTVESFWVCYCHLARPSSLPSPTDLHLFKEGIRPLWEDPANRNGGKWIIRFKKAVSGRFWEDLDMEKGKKSGSGRGYISWNDDMDKALLDTFVEYYNKGDRCQNGWKSHVYTAAIKNVREK